VEDNLYDLKEVRTPKLSFLAFVYNTTRTISFLKDPWIKKSTLEVLANFSLELEEEVKEDLEDNYSWAVSQGYLEEAYRGPEEDKILMITPTEKGIRCLELFAYPREEQEEYHDMRDVRDRVID
jgi:hypothetical protein